MMMGQLIGALLGIAIWALIWAGIISLVAMKILKFKPVFSELYRSVLGAGYVALTTRFLLDKFIPSDFAPIITLLVGFCAISILTGKLVMKPDHTSIGFLKGIILNVIPSFVFVAFFIGILLLLFIQH